MPSFLDTSIILRYLIRDDPEKATRSLDLLERAEKGDESLVTTDLVIAEVVWTLQSTPSYGLSPKEIRDLLLPLVTMRGLALPDKNLFPAIFQLYCDHNVDFVDAYNAVVMEKRGVMDLFSYDRHFDRLPFVRRKEP